MNGKNKYLLHSIQNSFKKFKKFAFESEPYLCKDSMGESLNNNKAHTHKCDTGSLAVEDPMQGVAVAKEPKKN